MHFKIKEKNDYIRIINLIKCYFAKQAQFQIPTISKKNY